MIGFFLGERSFSMLPVSLKAMEQVKGVDQPEKWNKKSIQEKHHCLFFDNSIRMIIVIMEGDVLNG